MIDSSIKELLISRARSGDSSVLKSHEFKSLAMQLKTLSPELKRVFGQELNSLRQSLNVLLEQSSLNVDTVTAIDVTAPWDANTPAHSRPQLLPSQLGSKHPLTTEIEIICDIYQRMGFVVEESREIDDDFHMFESLNFPDGHPARDDYDTFMTDEGLISPAHTSTMQNRILQKYRSNLENDEPIAAVVPDRVFRNEDLDATHEHTFYQIEGVYVGRNVTVGNLIATLSAFMNEYFGQTLATKLQPFYFPFTEPSFEFAIERPKILQKDDSEDQKWLELLGCGMIHPNVLRAADIDPVEYSGFAWGNGIERMVMMKYGIEDIRHFESANLKFLRQFA
ncbi:phenylalanine--tRNA ligase subunit alpha [Candidatus Saccharibacteria bacterium]|jgi:phenylalanyl-tRNA synthetase alpha chain|nr:phenylalanine--tRNA ligase subunit alpha [Candidatus Saccharibacteria bacterium]